MEFKFGENRISLILDDGQEAFITFGIEREKRVLVVSTTFVPENHRGKGIAGKLSQKLVEFAEENGYKIYPLCSYTEKFLRRKRPDLIAGDE
ncbi:MAG: N-acetyltransferase [Thermovibrio sp.]|nr:MAG: N-acetyltransferase [Thermovibrio sp.]